MPDDPQDVIPGDYEQLGLLIRRLNPYAQIDSVNLPPMTGELEELASNGIEVSGWLRDKTPGDPVLSCNHRMTVQEKQQCYYWTTLYPNEPTEAYPNDPNAALRDFEPDSPRMQNGKVTQNSADVVVHQVCKAIRVPFTYTREDGAVLTASILIGFVGSGGGQ